MVNMSHSFSEIRSHPDKPFLEHIRQTTENILRIHKNNRVSFPAGFDKFLGIIGTTHDLGKLTTFFQDYLKSKRRNEFTNHALLSSIFTFKALQELSEFQDTLWPAFGFWIVKRHHTNIENFSSEIDDLRDDGNISVLAAQFEDLYRNNRALHVIDELDLSSTVKRSLKSLIANCAKKAYLEKELKELRKYLLQKAIGAKIEDYFMFNYAYSILSISDVLSASSSSLDILELKALQNPFSTFRTEKSNSLSTKREELLRSYLEKVNSDLSGHGPREIYILSLPTGYGKTNLSLAIANSVSKKSNNNKIIYCLPFISIIDQTAKFIKDMINNNDLIEAHHLAYTEEKQESDSTNEGISLCYDAWSANYIISTFEQFLYSVFSGSKKKSIKISNLMNAVVIIDEIQALDSKYYGFIKELMQQCINKFRMKFILSSATIPSIFKEWGGYTDCLTFHPEIKFVDRYSSKFYEKEPSLPELSNVVLEHYANKKSVCVVFNSINLAVQFLENIKKDPNVFFLASTVTPKERLERIKNIKELLDGNRPCIVVSTQVIEAGVDLDFKSLFRQFAPLGSIIQASGRCNRHASDESGKVFVFKLDNSVNDPSNKVYGICPMDVSRELFPKGKELSENQLYDLYEKYDESLKKRGHSSKSDAILNDISQDIGTLQFREAIDKFKLIANAEKIEFVIELDEESKKLCEDLNECSKELKKLGARLFEEKKHLILKINMLHKQLAKYTISDFVGYHKDNTNLQIVDTVAGYLLIKNLTDFYDKSANHGTGLKRSKIPGILWDL